jgi:hypothetical protein
MKHQLEDAVRALYRMARRLFRGDAKDGLEDRRPMPALAFEGPAELVLETADRGARHPRLR